MQIEVNGQKVEAKSIGFSVVSENWNEYQTEDGRVVRTKLVLTRVLVPIEPLKNPDGTDVVVVQHQAVVIAEDAAPRSGNAN